MDYLTLLRDVALANIDEIEGALDQARHARHRAASDLEQQDRTVAAYEYLVELARPSNASTGSASLTLHEAMVMVLRRAPYHMLRAGDLAAEINGQHLYQMRDGRPVEAQQIHARVGQYPHLFVREGTFIKLVD